MRSIAQGFFEASPVMAAPLVGMGIFIAIFAVVIVRALRARTDEMERSAQLALSEEETKDVASGSS